MSKLNLVWKVPRTYNAERIEELFRLTEAAVNALAECRQDAYYQSRTSAPTTGTYAVGDWVKNSAPSELGTAGSQYIIFGWECVVSGTPGTWREVRTLTGN